MEKIVGKSTVHGHCRYVQLPKGNMLNSYLSNLDGPDIYRTAIDQSGHAQTMDNMGI